MSIINISIQLINKKNRVGYHFIKHLAVGEKINDIHVDNTSNPYCIAVIYRDGAADQLRTKTPRGTTINRLFCKL